MRIGEAARRTGVSREAIRFYERRGLLAAPERLANSYRVYPEGVIDALKFIRAAQELGFSLEEIRRAMPLLAGGGTHSADIRGLVKAKLGALEDRIARLRSMHRRLLDVFERCARSPSDRLPRKARRSARGRRSRRRSER
jgi:DNA-binding transcriptional MerR regulator